MPSAADPKTSKQFQPYVSAQKSIAEFTIKAVLLGIFLTLIMSAANAYVGLYAGMTVSASIPAAVISMGILRGLLRRGTILENNIVQTIASAGESLAAGIIFTVPALVLTGVWTGFKFWPIFLIALLGGILGVVFMIPLRRSLIVEEETLIYPEGVACAEVLEVGEEGGTGFGYIISALGVGFIFKFFVNGVSIIKETVEGAIRAGKTVLYFGSDIAVVLIGVGFIVGFNISLLVFIGGALAWLIGLPILGLFRGLEPGVSALDGAWGIWGTEIRYMGIGAMVVGGIWSIIKIRHGIGTGVREALFGYRDGQKGGLLVRTEQNLSRRSILVLLIMALVPIFLLYTNLIGSASIGLVSTVAMVVSAFFFVAVSSYIVGLVGSSNNPVSGMTICTILFASVLLLLFGMSGNSGILAALGVAGVVCCALCTAGDVSQDLKTGHLLGATPRKQQLAQLVGVAAAAFIMAPTLTLLNNHYGIGTGEPGALQAAQATLFANIVRPIFSGQPLPWLMIGIGALVGIALIVIDEALRARGSDFRAHVMPVAVGIYLPLSLSVPILAGGLVSLMVGRLASRKGPEAAREAQHRGTLLSSGLIAGEAIMGIGVAFFVWLTGVKMPIHVLESDLLSIFLFLVIIFLLAWFALRGRRITSKFGGAN
ncbi:OPT family oligopeptide transporter [Candidatus Zixiibacteriota bacterium]